MSRRRVSTTVRHRTMLGSRSTTYAYDQQAGPSRTSRFLAFTGVSPWQPKRAAVAAWVFVWLMIAGQSPVASAVFMVLSAVIFGGWLLRRQRVARAAAIAASRPPAPIPGPSWCDHCADWTVHPTGQHVAA